MRFASFLDNQHFAGGDVWRAWHQRRQIFPQIFGRHSISFLPRHGLVGVVFSAQGE